MRRKYINANLTLEDLHETRPTCFIDLNAPKLASIDHKLLKFHNRPDRPSSSRHLSCASFWLQLSCTLEACLFYLKVLFILTILIKYPHTLRNCH